LRHNNSNSYSLPSLKGCALIRELHVYGQHAHIGSKNKNSVQHKGFGSKLIKKAEQISIGKGYKTMAVISGVGVRGFYKKKGYKLGDDDYMYKGLVNHIQIYKYLFIIAGFLILLDIYYRLF